MFAPALSQRILILSMALFAMAVSAAGALATPGDTLWVRTWDEDFINWADPHDSTFVFPDSTLEFSKVALFYTIGCPPAPGDCDPWDRLGYTQILRDVGGNIEALEIARIITPYDITGGNYPGTCTWEIDVSDYSHLLRNEVTLRNYIESWIGGNRGWLATLDFAFIEGIPEYDPQTIEILWHHGRAVYGDPGNPIEALLAPVTRTVDPMADAVKVRVTTTGHGQGNTGNCAEFCYRWHEIQANGNPQSHYLWRSDCNQNPCSPQGGTWTYPRAGWCPGDAVTPWDVDITPFVTPGETADLDYNIQPYENYCRPNNPGCVDGQTCPDCDYNYNGHTEPHFTIQSQLITYRYNANSDVAEGGLLGPDGLLLRPNSPNPFRGPTWIRYSLEAPGAVRLGIYDAGGRLVRELEAGHENAGDFAQRWDGRDESGRLVPAGVYLCRVQSGGRSAQGKLVVLR